MESEIKKDKNENKNENISKNKKEYTKNEEISRSLMTVFRKKIYAPFLNALDKYDMIKDGDKIMVCISGGKDSFLLAKCLTEIQKYGNKKFELFYVLMDPGFLPEILEKIEENAKIFEFDLKIFRKHIFKIAEKQEKGGCYLCAKMRRGSLYGMAEKIGANKIALGHHMSDAIETALLNIFWGSEFKAMMPKLKSSNFNGLELIRPLYLVNEEDIIAWQKYNDLEFIKCACPLTDYKQKVEGVSKRDEVKNLIKNMKKENPNIEKSIFNASENVNLDAISRWKKDGKYHNFLDEY